MLKKQRIWVLAFLAVLSASCTRAAQEQSTQEQAVQQQTAPQPAAQAPVTREPSAPDELVYLKVETVTPSSFDDTPDWAPPQDPRAPLDGDLNTRWASKFIEDQWISFDFGKKKTVTLVKILWEQAYPVEYEILASDDGEQWKTVKLLEGQTGSITEIPLEAPVEARLIKVLSKKRAKPEWGISMWEIEFYGPKSLNPGDTTIEEALPGHRSFTDEMKLPPQTGMEEPQPSPGALTPEEFQKGVVYTSWGTTELGESASDKTLEHLYAKGVRHIAIMIPWFQDSNEAKSIFPDTVKDTPVDEVLVHAINTCHRLGIKVMLKPHIDTRDGAWRGEIVPNEEWFISLEDFTVRYAKLAAKYNVEVYCIGTELVNATINAYAEKWNRIIDKVKEHYNGPLIYAANWDEYHYVCFWQRMDFVGIDAYFPLTNKADPTLEELKTGWTGIADKLEQWLTKDGITKPVVFTEIGYSSADGTNQEPWKTMRNKVDEQEQADCLTALFEVLSGRSWFKGMYWWQYFPQERFNPTGFIIRAKIAEGVLSDWYSNKIK